jgi:hypothetical protein
MNVRVDSQDAGSYQQVSLEIGKDELKNSLNRPGVWVMTTIEITLRRKRQKCCAIFTAGTAAGSAEKYPAGAGGKWRQDGH